MQARSLSVVIRSPLRACMLINHRRPLGTAVDDGVIVQKFDPGRTPVRQALKELRQERLPCALPRPGMGGARCSPGHIAQPGPSAACRLPHLAHPKLAPCACTPWCDRIWRRVLDPSPPPLNNTPRP